MRSHLIALLALVGCTQSNSSTPLAEIANKYGDTTLEIVSRGQIAVNLHVAPTGSDCPSLSEDAVATFDGQNMMVARGGYATTATGCYPIGFWFDAFPEAQVQAWERTTSAAQLVIADRSAEWRIDTGLLLTQTFVDDPANSLITWTDVTQVTQATLSPVVPVTIKGNTIHYPAGTAVTAVVAIAHPVASRCDGPSTCTVFLEGSHDWTISP
jgi:hypothetical protein